MFHMLTFSYRGGAEASQPQAATAAAVQKHMKAA